MLVKEIMSIDPVTVGMDDRLKKVQTIFDERKFHHLLVVEENELVGIISDRDLLRAISPNLGTARVTYFDELTLIKPVHSIMTRQVFTLLETDTVVQAIDMFNTHRISCLPVVDANKKPIGIVSWRDILKNFAKIRQH